MDSTIHTTETTTTPEAKTESQGQVQATAGAEETKAFQLPFGWTWGWTIFLGGGVVGAIINVSCIMEHVVVDPATNSPVDVAYAFTIASFETFILSGLIGLLGYLILRDSTRALKKYGIIGDHRVLFPQEEQSEEDVDQDRGEDRSPDRGEKQSENQIENRSEEDRSAAETPPESRKESSPEQKSPD